MAKALVVTSFIALTIGLAVGYPKECAVGPEYWCRSFKNAEDCGALNHCTQAVWNYDDKYALVGSSTTCQWCQKILGNTQQGLGENEDMIISTLTSGCQLLPSDDLSAKCTNVVEKYGTSVVTLMKNKRYATLCRLMNICSTDEKPMIVGNNRCTWGPSYWCSSLSNSRQCASIDHCSNQIWSQQAIEKKANDNICQYCEYIIEKLRSFITENQTEINVRKWLAGACSMLQNKEAIDKCVQTMSEYAEEILLLIKNNIDSGIICHLGQMCQDATIITREKSNDEKSKMLCNVIVRATHELHFTQQKNQNEIEIFLKNDCQQLSTSELKQKCGNLVEKYGDNIYEHVVNNMELSKICENTAVQPLGRNRCDLCTFILSTTKAMMDENHPDDKILGYIDEQLCSRFNGEMKKNCKYIIEKKGTDLIDKILQGTQPMLICSYFQVCFNEIIDNISPIEKDEIQSFFEENFCDQLGPFEKSCYALIAVDTTRLFKTLVNDIDGDVLCQIFGICTRKTSLIDNLSIKDDTNKCKRCMDDFTRRKHIAGKLLNHSSEFLHHLCGQLPQKDECTKSVDKSINTLVKFIQSLNPQDICLELKACDKTLLEKIQITASDSEISEEVMVYIKDEICAQLGPLSSWCNHLTNSEGADLFRLISKKIDPHQVCSVMDICPMTTAFANCTDKCQCCVSKMENYQVQLAAFLQTMLTTAEALCDQMPYSDECQEIASGFKSNIDEIISNFNAKQICQILTHCSSSPAKCDIDGDKCPCCQNNFNIRRTNFHQTINEITTTLVSLCPDNNCRSNIQSKQEQTFNHIDKINFLTLCQRFGFCSREPSQRSIPFLSNLMVHTYSDLDASIQDLSENLCSSFDEFKPICEQVFISTETTRYLNVYMALLKNNPAFIDQDFREHSTDTCDGCKNAVQSSKNFSLNALESVLNALLQACNSCPVKDQCQKYINQQFDNLKSYINQINPEQFCQKIHLCSVALTDTCSTCIQRLGLKQDSILQGIDRLAGYFEDLCQQYPEKECQIFVKEIKDSIQKSIGEFDIKQTCTSIGFCGIDAEENEMDYDEYERNLEDEIEKKICSTLGPLESLCQDILHGKTEEIQALEMNYSINDLMQIGEESTDTEDGKDKCQCCIARVVKKKRRTKFIGDAIFYALTRSCDRCPAKHQCRRYWRMAKALFDAHINKICPYQVCVRLNYCNKTAETTKPEIEEIKPIEDSNSTCILCEYVMNSLSNFIQRQSTEEEIEEQLQQICNQIPSVLKNQCREYIDNYGPSIISILLRDFDLSTICQKLNLCTKQMKVDITHVMKANTVSCGICDYISTYIHFALQRDSNEKSLQHALSTVCTHLSEEQSSKCQTIIQLFSPYIRQLELSPGNNFCQQLTICQTPMVELKPGISLNKEDTKSEEVPEDYLDDYLAEEDVELSVDENESADQSSSSEIEATTVGNEATTVGNEATTVEIEATTVGNEATTVEIEATTVGNEATTVETEATTVETDLIEQLVIDQPLTPETPSQTLTCTLCQYVISYLDAALKNNKSEEAVEEALKKVCTILPEKLRTECDQFIASYGAVIAELIAGLADPDTICRELGVCQDSTTKKSTTVIVQTAYTCTICQYIVSRMKYFAGLNQEKNEVFTSLKGSCDLFSVTDLQKQCKDFLDQHAADFFQSISNDIQPKIACQGIGICGENYREVTTSTPATTSSSIKYGKCIFGMKYWCTSRANAELCNAVEVCERQVWSKTNLVIY